MVTNISALIFSILLLSLSSCLLVDIIWYQVSDNKKGFWRNSTLLLGDQTEDWKLTLKVFFVNPNSMEE